MTTRKALVLLLGMHRSGTSLAAQAFARAGLPLGEHLLLEPTPDNPHGYWEDKEIVAIHSALLTMRFGDRQDFCAAGLDKAISPSCPQSALDEARARLITAVYRRLARSSVFGFKDPRAARLLPLWKTIAEELHLDLIPLLLLRNPASVAASLKTRDGLPLILGELLWLRSVIDVITEIGDTLIGVIAYEDWFERPARNRQIVSRTLAAAGIQENIGWQLPVLQEHWHARSSRPALPLVHFVHSSLLSAQDPLHTASARREILAQVNTVIDAFGGWIALANTISRGLPPVSDDGLLLNFPLETDAHQASKERFEAGSVTLLNGNPHCRPSRGHYVLRANPPNQQCVELWWHGVRAPKAAHLTGTLSAQPLERTLGTNIAVRIEVTRSEDRSIATESHIVLAPRDTTPFSIALPPKQYVDIRLKLTIASSNQTQGLPSDLMLSPLQLLANRPEEM